MISPAVVLIVDDKLGFVAWLGARLAANGYGTVPVTSAFVAQQLVDELRVSPDLSIVNLELASTVELVEALHRANPGLKVIAIEDATPIARRIEVDAAHSRSEDSWLATVERVLHLRNASEAP